MKEDSKLINKNTQNFGKVGSFQVKWNLYTKIRNMEGNFSYSVKKLFNMYRMNS